MKTKKYRPYVRRANGRARGDSLRTALRLAFYRERGRPFYVMVQHGVPNNVIGVGATRRDLERSPLPVAVGKMTFRRWSRRVQALATKGSTP